MGLSVTRDALGPPPPKEILRLSSFCFFTLLAPIPYPQYCSIPVRYWSYKGAQSISGQSFSLAVPS
jgi:hypothetical protein